MIPSCVPIITPHNTENENRNIVLGMKFIDVMLPKRPDIELKRINAAAVPEAPLIVVQPRIRISGDKKIPPPVPVSPESKPIIYPAKKPINGFTVLLDFTLKYCEKLNIN